jgi:hypothetical protein
MIYLGLWSNRPWYSSLEEEKNCHKKLGFKKKQMQVPILYSVNKCFHVKLSTKIIDKHEDKRLYFCMFFLFFFFYSRNLTLCEKKNRPPVGENHQAEADKQTDTYFVREESRYCCTFTACPGC